MIIAQIPKFVALFSGSYQVWGLFPKILASHQTPQEPTPVPSSPHPAPVNPETPALDFSLQALDLKTRRLGAPFRPFRPSCPFRPSLHSHRPRSEPLKTPGSGTHRPAVEPPFSTAPGCTLPPHPSNTPRGTSRSSPSRDNFRGSAAQTSRAPRSQGELTGLCWAFRSHISRP